MHEVECAYGEGDERGLSELYLLWGQFYEDGGNYASAIKQYNLALELDQRSDDALGQASAHIRLARTFRRRGQRDRAQDQLTKAGQLLAGSEDDIEKAALLTEEGHLAIAASNYDRAINRFTGALRVAEEDGDQRRIAVARRSLALAHWEDGSQERALELLLSALPILEERGDLREKNDLLDEVGDDVGRSEAHLELGDCYRQEGRYDDAVIQYKEARRLDRWHGDLRRLSQALRKLGEVYFLRGELERAAESYEQAEDYLRSVDFADDRGLLALDRGQLFAARNRHDDAITEFEAALTDFDIAGMDDKKTETYRRSSPPSTRSDASTRPSASCARWASSRPACGNRSSTTCIPRSGRRASASTSRATTATPSPMPSPRSSRCSPSGRRRSPKE